METVIVKLIEEFREKACSIETQQAADEILMKKLKMVLTDDEYVELLIAYGNCTVGKGDEDFIRTCNELIAKYK